MMSKAEKEFRSKYLHANVRPTGREYCPFAVYAGDYICAEGPTKAEAFKLALDYDKAGIITPDPNEVREESMIYTIEFENQNHKAGSEIELTPAFLQA